MKISGLFYLMVVGVCIFFIDFFLGWGIEWGFSVLWWNFIINGFVFLKLDLKLRSGVLDLDG